MQHWLSNHVGVVIWSEDRLHGLVEVFAGYYGLATFWANGWYDMPVGIYLYT
jgi:hypothetical protein